MSMRSAARKFELGSEAANLQAGLLSIENGEFKIRNYAVENLKQAGLSPSSNRLVLDWKRAIAPLEDSAHGNRTA